MKYDFSKKADGDMRLSYDPSEWKRENIANRNNFFTSLGLGEKKIITAGLVHKKTVVAVNKNSPDFIPATDGLVTVHPEIVLTVTGADCFPVFFMDEIHHTIGLAHVGWRGAVGGILSEITEKLFALGAQLETLTVILGPGICTEHFVIKPENIHQFDAYPESVIRKNEKVHIDLINIIHSQLKKNGIENIRESGECTYCLPHSYFSYRRDKPETVEAQLAYITL